MRPSRGGCKSRKIDASARNSASVRRLKLASEASENSSGTSFSLSVPSSPSRSFLGYSSFGCFASFTYSIASSTGVFFRERSRCALASRRFGSTTSSKT